MKFTATVCDLCHDQPPSLYCSSDSAFLCSDCDSHVHAANFLVARHIRLSLCSLCKSFTGRHHSSSTLPLPLPPLCTSCYDDALSSSSSCSSACISSTDKTSPKTKSGATVVSSKSADEVMSDWKTRDVLISWCTRLGVTIGSSTIIEVASHAFEVSCLDRSGLPYRVGLAASLWFSLFRFRKDDEKKKMRTLVKRLEVISGVPAKSIVVAESKLAGMLKMMKHRRGHHHQEAVEEGWAEC